METKQIEKQKPRKLSYFAICPANGNPHRWILAGEILGETELFELQASPSEEICQDCWGLRKEYKVES